MAACQYGYVAIAIVNTQGDTTAMKNIMGLMLSLSLVLGAATVTFAADEKKTDKMEKKEKKGKKKSTDKATDKKM